MEEDVNVIVASGPGVASGSAAEVSVHSSVASDKDITSNADIAEDICLVRCTDGVVAANVDS